MEITTVSDVKNEARKSTTSFLSILKKINLRINQAFLVIAGICLVASMLLVVLNVFIRIVVNPIPGTVEVVGWLTAISIAFTLGNAQIKRSHVYIDLLFEKFSPKWKRVINFTLMLVCCMFFSVLAWQMMKYGLAVQSRGLLSENLRIPFHFIIMFISLGFVGLVSTLLLQSIEAFSKEEEHGS